MKYITFIKLVQIVKTKFNETTLKKLLRAMRGFTASLYIYNQNFWLFVDLSRVCYIIIIFVNKIIFLKNYLTFFN